MGNAVMFSDVLSTAERDAIEAAVPRGRQFVDVDLRGWARPVEFAIRSHADRFLRQFPDARKAIGNSMRAEGGSALWWSANPSEKNSTGWHRDPLPRSRLFAFWYGGKFEGGQLETEDGLYSPERNALLVFWPGIRHRVLPVTVGARLSVHVLLSRWRG